MNRRPLLLGFAAWLALASCDDSNRIAGNSANTGNSVVAGRILDPSGTPAKGIWVECRPDSLTPWQQVPTGWSSSTDSTGRYHCTDLPSGRIGIASFDPGSGLSRWRGVLVAPSDRTDTSYLDTLAAPGTLWVALPPGTTGTLFLTGLGLSAPVEGRQEVEISGIPAGWVGKVQLAGSATSYATLDSSSAVPPGSTDSAGYTRQSQSLRVSLAGGLAGAISQFPLLVRLDSSWTGFPASLADGSDLRLSTTGGRPLPLTVASWDKAGRTGTMWTLLDSLSAPGDSVDLVLSWGIPVPSGNPTAAFSSSRGWLADWPLGDSGSTAQDRLGTFPGTLSNSGGLVPGIAGVATHFDGKRTQIVVASGDTGALALPQGGPFTYSCWVRLGGYGTARYAMGRGQEGPGIEYLPAWAGDTNVWLGQDYDNAPAGANYRLAHADTATWTHLALTVSGTTVSLYVDGVRQALDSGFNTSTVGRKALPFMIGASIDTAGLTSTSIHLLGDMSEVWVQNVSRSPDWIRMVATNERPGAAAAIPLSKP